VGDFGRNSFYELRWNLNDEGNSLLFRQCS